MSYQWPLDPRNCSSSATRRWSTPRPGADADAMRSAITDMWADAPGGWVFEWSQLGARYAGEGNEALATLAYGWARFPVLADDAKREALKRQVEHYLLAAEDFPVDFERRFLELPYRARPRAFPSTSWQHRVSRPDAPVLIASGGVDSLEDGPPQHLRRVRPQLPRTGGRVRHPGHRRVPDLAEPRLGRAGRVARRPRQGDGGRTVGHLGISMGGYFSAATGLAGTSTRR